MRGREGRKERKREKDREKNGREQTEEKEWIPRSSLQNIGSTLWVYDAKY